MIVDKNNKEIQNCLMTVFLQSKTPIFNQSNIQRVKCVNRGESVPYNGHQNLDFIRNISAICKVMSHLHFTLYICVIIRLITRLIVLFLFLLTHLIKGSPR